MNILLRWLLPHKDIGWTEIGEEFTRFVLMKTRYFNVYLHRLKALSAHPHCHDHPWSFIAILLRGGYYEYHASRWTWRRVGSVLYRPAEFSHNVVTKGVSWSVIITGRNRRSWLFHECEA